MADIVLAEVRSRMMAGIQGKNTKPELVFRKALHAAGFRYRLHDRRLPRVPDLILPRYRAAIFVNGCFWHGHNCPMFKLPAARPGFWRAKITRNMAVDVRNAELLEDSGWRRAVVWECVLKGKSRRPLADVISTCASWLHSNETTIDIRGS